MMRWLLVVFAALVALAQPGAAHESRPAYLDIQELGQGTYDVLWNAFKHLAKGYSADEKTALFSGTAKRVYRLDL